MWNFIREGLSEGYLSKVKWRVKRWLCRPLHEPFKRTSLQINVNKKLRNSKIKLKNNCKISLNKKPNRACTKTQNKAQELEPAPRCLASMFCLDSLLLQFSVLVCCAFQLCLNCVTHCSSYIIPTWRPHQITDPETSRNLGL